MTESEMKRMQQEAVRRAEEMQNRARAVQQQSQPSDNKPEPPAERINPPIAENIRKPPEIQNETGGLFETLMKDKERTLILGLILLLMDEKTDNSLILALMYLLI